MCYILSQDYGHLSNDRLSRVQGCELEDGNNDQQIDVSVVCELEKIYILDWCLFENPNTGKCLLGHVLQFAYMDETTWRKIEFTKPSANVHVETKTGEEKRIGVLCEWYTIEKSMNLEHLKIKVHGYLDIEYYKMHVPKPSKNGSKIFVEKSTYSKIKKLL